MTNLTEEILRIEVLLEGEGEKTFYGTYSQLQDCILNTFRGVDYYQEEAGYITEIHSNKVKYLRLARFIAVPIRDLNHIPEQFHRSWP